MLATTLFLVVTIAASTPVEAQSDADLGGLLLPENELAGAAADCGIGPAGEHFGPVAVAALPAPVIGLGKWVGGLVAGHIKGVITRRLGMDEEHNRFLALSGQMRRIEGQLKALDERFDRLGDQMRAKDFRDMRDSLAREFVEPVENGTHRLMVLACQEAALIDDEQAKRDTKVAQANRDDALGEFGNACRDEGFANIPANLTRRFRAPGASILDRYVETMIQPQRYLTRQQSQDVEDFFYHYHLVQIQALRLTAECRLRFPAGSERGMNDPGLRDWVADRTYRAPNSNFNVAQMGTLPQILPTLLPEGVVLDAKTGTLWWNGTDFGAHPYTNQRGLVREHTIEMSHDVEFLGGTRRFELASFPDVEKLAALNAVMPSARANSASHDRYPATLKPFLVEIGLDKVAERIPDSGNLSFVWTSDRGISIRRCYTNVDHPHDYRCTKWYDPHESLGFNAGTAPANEPKLRSASGTTFFAPLQCRPNGCNGYWNENRRVISLCKDKTWQDARNRCIPDDVLGLWQAAGIYRSAKLKTDRFFSFDMTRLR